VAPKWEYLVQILGSFWRGPRPEDVQKFLTQAAEDGWEPLELTTIQNSSKMMLLLRRPIETAGRRRRAKTWP